MPQSSFYDVLLLDQNATLDDIKQAFKRRALQVHPDKGGSKEEFHLVYKALETLGDPVARRKYDHGLATKTTMAPQAKYSSKDPAATSKAHRPNQQQVPRRKSTHSKAPTPRATAEKPQSMQAKLLMKIHDLLKRLPRDMRHDVISNQLSQKQRVVLEKWMVDNVDTSSSKGQGHSETKALAFTTEHDAPSQPGCRTFAKGRQSMADEVRPFARSEKSNGKTERKKRVTSGVATKPSQCTTAAQASDMQFSIGEAANDADAQTAPHPDGMTETNHAMHNSMCGEDYFAVAVPAAITGHIDKANQENKRKEKKASGKRAPRGSGYVRRNFRCNSSYCAGICFDSLDIRTAGRDLKTALEDLVILTAVRQKMRNLTHQGTFVESLQAALVSSATEHGRNLSDLKLFFSVFQYTGCFTGSPLRSPCVRSLEVFGKMRGILEPFRQYAKLMGRRNVYWRYSPVHLNDAWERFQSAVADAWEMAGVDNTAILQKIHCLYEARDPFRRASLQRWEQLHMAKQDENGLRERKCAGRLEGWERRSMAMQDKNSHRPRRLRDRNPNRSLEFWERQQMAVEDKNKHRPRRLRLKSQLRKFSLESPWSRRLSALGKLIARWGQMLRKEDKEREKTIRQKKAQQKKDRQKRRREEILNRKRRQEEERLRRESVRKRMRSDLTMDDILGPKACCAPSDKGMWTCPLGKGLSWNHGIPTIHIYTLYINALVQFDIIYGKFMASIILVLGRVIHFHTISGPHS